MNIFIIIGLVVVVALIMFGLIITSIFNKLTKLRNKVKKDWIDVDLGLKMRYELVPQLVEVAKGYAAHEEKLYSDIAKARQLALASFMPRSEMEADNEVTEAVHKIYTLAEDYPELKSNENFIDLQRKLSSIEVKIAGSREIYNDTVMKYKIATESFPGRIVAKMFGFLAEQYIIAAPEERELPDLELTSSKSA